MKPDAERIAEIARTLLETTLAPFGGPAACIDAYEDGIRVLSELHAAIAQVVGVEPARSYAASCADLTRDIGATQVSSARWMLDV
jgi:hypothetical protein